MKKYLIFILVVIVAMSLIGFSCKSSSKTNPTAPTATPGTKVVDDGSSASNANNMGGYWFTINDCADGGASTVSPTAGAMGGTFFKVSAGTGVNFSYAAHMAGSVNIDNGTTGYIYGFIGMATQFSGLAGATTLTTGCSPTDLSSYTGVQFYVKLGPTDGGQPYKVILAYTDNGAGAMECPTPTSMCPGGGNGCTHDPTCTDNAAACQCASADIQAFGDFQNQLGSISSAPAATTTWQLETIPFSNFSEPTWDTSDTEPISTVLKNAKQLAWQTVTNPGPCGSCLGADYNVDLYVGDVVLYH